MAPLLFQNFVLLALIFAWVESFTLDPVGIKWKPKEASQQQQYPNTISKMTVDIQIPFKNESNSSSKPSNDEVVTPMPRTAKEIMDMIENKRMRFKNFNEGQKSRSKQNDDEQQDEKRFKYSRRGKKRRLGSQTKSESQYSILEVERNLVSILDTLRHEGTSAIKTSANSILDGLEEGELNVEKAIADMPDIPLLHGPKQAVRTLIALQKQVRKTVKEGPIFDDISNSLSFNQLVQPLEIVLSFLSQNQNQNQNYNDGSRRYGGSKSTHDDGGRRDKYFDSESYGIMDIFAGIFKTIMSPFNILMNAFSSN